jgi:hypothetical protein
MVGVVGKAIKGFGKALKTAKRNKASKQVFDHIKGKPFPPRMQKKFQAADKRRAGMKKEGYKQEPYILSGKKSKTGAHKLKEMWSYDPHKMPKKSKLKKIAIKTAPIGAAAAAGEAYGRHREKSKGKK